MSRMADAEYLREHLVLSVGMIRRVITRLDNEPVLSPDDHAEMLDLVGDIIDRVDDMNAVLTVPHRR